jgi:hypothetical protein
VIIGEASEAKDFAAPLQSGVYDGLVELLLQAPISAEQTAILNITFFIFLFKGQTQSKVFY